MSLRRRMLDAWKQSMPVTSGIGVGLGGVLALREQRLPRKTQTFGENLLQCTLVVTYGACFGSLMGLFPLASVPLVILVWNNSRAPQD